MGFGLVGVETDEGNIGAVGVLSSSLGIWGVSGREPCQVNRCRNSLKKISVNNMKPCAQNSRFYFPHSVKALRGDRFCNRPSDTESIRTLVIT